MACMRCETSSYAKHSSIDRFFIYETWLSAQSNEGKTVELAPSGFDVKTFARQSRSHGDRIAAIYKSSVGSNNTFKTNFEINDPELEVQQASINLHHNTLP